MFLFASLFLGYIFVSYIQRKYKYWAERDIKNAPTWPIVGNLGKVILKKESDRQCLANIYNQYPDEKIVGLYFGLKPILLIRDPELIKQILTNDFHHFQDVGRKFNKNKLNKNLFEVDGKEWKLLRQKLSPVFTLRKLKNMVPLIQECAKEYMSYVENIVENKVDHEIKSLKSKYTIKVVGSCIFGLNLNAFVNIEDKFYRMAKRTITFTPFFRCLFYLEMIIPGVITLFDTTADIYEFFLDLVTKIIKERQNEPEEIKRKDFMEHMIELKEKVKLNGTIEDNIIVDDAMITAQALAFYTAGFETSSASMSFMLHELAYHQDIQDKVYVEISQIVTKYNGEISYEAIKEMVYLEMVFEETLRKNSVGSVIQRKATSNYKVPGSNIIIPKDTIVYISVSGLHNDKKYFPNPEKFNPENFSTESKKDRPECTYLPFGIGPRHCMGMGFAQIQSMIGIVAFLMKFKVEPSSKSKYEYDDDPNCITFSSAHGIWLRISKR